MEKIKSYIWVGKGIGMVFLLAAAVLSALVMIFALRSMYAEVKPDILLIADEFLPFTFKSGKIVQPADTYKKIDLDLGGKGNSEDIFPVVLDTKHDMATFVPVGDKGLFILSDTIYSLFGGEIRRVSLETQADGLFTVDDFARILDNMVGMGAALVSVGLVVIFFLFYLLKVWLVTLLIRMGQKLMKKTILLQLGQLMRLSAIVVAGFEVFAMLCGQIFAVYLTNFQIFVVEFFIVAIVLFKSDLLTRESIYGNCREELLGENNTDIKD